MRTSQVVLGEIWIHALMARNLTKEFTDSLGGWLPHTHAHTGSPVTGNRPVVFSVEPAIRVSGSLVDQVLDSSTCYFGPAHACEVALERQSVCPQQQHQIFQENGDAAGQLGMGRHHEVDIGRQVAGQEGRQMKGILGDATAT